MGETTQSQTIDFTGKEWVGESGLFYFGARYYDPMIGMWLSVDPMRQFASPYVYAGNGVNPMTGVDPDGEQVGELSGPAIIYMALNAPRLFRLVTSNPTVMNMTVKLMKTSNTIYQNLATNPTVQNMISVTSDFLNALTPTPNPPPTLGGLSGTVISNIDIVSEYFNQSYLSDDFQFEPSLSSPPLDALELAPLPQIDINENSNFSTPIIQEAN